MAYILKDLNGETPIRKYELSFSDGKKFEYVGSRNQKLIFYRKAGGLAVSEENEDLRVTFSLETGKTTKLFITSKQGKSQFDIVGKDIKDQLPEKIYLAYAMLYNEEPVYQARLLLEKGNENETGRKD